METTEVAVLYILWSVFTKKNILNMSVHELSFFSTKKNTIKVGYSKFLKTDGFTLLYP